jgi:hypothetical protein
MTVPKFVQSEVCGQWFEIDLRIRADEMQLRVFGDDDLAAFELEAMKRGYLRGSKAYVFGMRVQVLYRKLFSKLRWAVNSEARESLL